MLSPLERSADAWELQRPEGPCGISEGLKCWLSSERWSSFGKRVVLPLGGDGGIVCSLPVWAPGSLGWYSSGFPVLGSEVSPSPPSGMGGNGGVLGTLDNLRSAT